MVWLGIMIYSALIGAFFAYKCSNKYGIFGALVVPFTGFAILTLIEVYFWPGGGAPMLLLVWLIALPLTAITSFVSYMLVEAFIQSKAQQNK